MTLNFHMPWYDENGQAERSTQRWRTVPQRRVSGTVDHLRPQRWNWSLVARPLDEQVERQAQQPLQREQVVGLRYFWLDGLFSAISENFYLNFIPLFALAYGASNGQMGWVMAIGNLLGALALFPGARLVESLGKRKSLIVWTGGGMARLALLFMAFIPLVIVSPPIAIIAIVMLNGLRAFMSNLANPAWTALVADLVPAPIRGRYLSSRAFAMGVAALCVSPLAGWLIENGNGWRSVDLLGYQIVFVLSFVFGIVGTLNFRRIPEPPLPAKAVQTGQQGTLRRAMRRSPGFAGLVISAFVWNLAIQVAAPFFNVYLVDQLGGTTATVGVMGSITSLFALLGQIVFGAWVDKKGTIWVQWVSGFPIVLLPLGWMMATEVWHIGVINAVGGLLWAGYNLSNFNLLLELTPDEQRPRAVALFQTVVFGSAFIGPLLGGYLADAVGFRAIFGISGAGRLIGVLLFLWLAARPALRMGKGGPTRATTDARPTTQDSPLRRRQTVNE